MAGLLPFLLTPKDYELYEMSGKKSEEEEEEPVDDEDEWVSEDEVVVRVACQN